LKDHGHVCADVDTLELIPDEACELELRVLIAILNKLEPFVLVDLVVMILAILTHVILTAISSLNRDTLESFNHCIEEDSTRGENGKFSVVGWVKLDFAVVLSIARKLSLWLDGNFLVLLEVIHRYAEVRDSSNHQEVATIS
jgi:hypothetical protein